MENFQIFPQQIAENTIFHGLSLTVTQFFATIIVLNVLFCEVRSMQMSRKCVKRCKNICKRILSISLKVARDSQCFLICGGHCSSTLAIIEVKKARMCVEAVNACISGTDRCESCSGWKRFCKKFWGRNINCESSHRDVEEPPPQEPHCLGEILAPVCMACNQANTAKQNCEVCNVPNSGCEDWRKVTEDAFQRPFGANCFFRGCDGNTC